MKKKSLYILALVVLVAVVTIGCTSAPTTPAGKTTATSDKETIKIGLVASLTGDNANLGQPTKKGMVIALEEQQQNDSKYNYEFIYEDDRLDNKLAASAAQKLINIDKVDAIISFSSGTGNVINPMAENAKVIHCGIASDANIANGQYNFIHWTQPPEEGRVFVKKLQEKGIKKVAIFELNHPGTQAMGDGFRQNIPGTDIEITGTYKYNFGDTDFRNTLLKIKKDEPDILMILAISPELDLFVKQLKELNMDIPLTSIEMFDYTETPEMFNGYWYVQAADPVDDFKTKYETRFGESIKPGAGNTYDCSNMIMQAYETIDSTTKPSTAQVATYLHSIENYQGAMGTLKVDEQGIVQSKAVVKMVQDGEFVTIS